MTEENEENKSALSPRDTYWNEEWLRERYFSDEMTFDEIADVVDVSRATISRWMDRHDIERRSQTRTTQSEDIEVKGWKILSTEDGLERSERITLREKQAKIVEEIQQVKKQCENELEQFAIERGFDLEDISERLDAKTEFEELAHAEPFEECKSELINSLAEVYMDYLKGRFETPTEQTKKERIVALKTAFGIESNDRAIMEALGASRRYVKEFKVFTDVEVDGTFVGTRSFDPETHENGDPAVVLQRYRRQQNRYSQTKREKVFSRDGNKCLKCGATETLELHHITPLSRGGNNEIENLATLCKDCHEEARLYLKLFGEEVPAYPRNKFEEWVEGTLNICGAITTDGTPCENPEGSCPHHG